MAVDLPKTAVARGTTRGVVDLLREFGLLRTLVRGAGICWSVLFVTAGLGCGLQLYGDGAIFSYAIAVQNTWAFHWHNIPSRLFVHLFAHVPAETYVALTHNPGGGIAVYGLLFFAAPLLGLVATYVTDRSHDRVLFTFACLSTACLCPLVFGFPTEMWIAHSLFWPALAICHYVRRDAMGMAAILSVLVALAFTHEGALILEAGILASLALRGVRSFHFLRASAALLVVLVVWIAVRLAVRPDEYFASIIFPAALDFIDVTALAQNPILLIVAAVAAYGVVVAGLRRVAPAHAHIGSAAIIALGLVAYWLFFDKSLHASNRYAFRTALLVATPVLGALASALAADRRLTRSSATLSRLLALFRRYAPSPAVAGAILLIMLVHAVETAKFISAWARYKAAVRALATGTLSDPWLGDAQFVSAGRIGAGLSRLSWPSTTPYLSVLVSPGLRPKRLVVEPDAGYYWLSCQLAAASHEAKRSIPSESRRLVQMHACLHRPI